MENKDIEVTHEGADKKQYYVIQRVETYIYDDKTCRSKSYVSELKFSTGMTKSASLSYGCEQELCDKVSVFYDRDKAERRAKLIQFVHDTVCEISYIETKWKKYPVKFKVKKVTTTVR